jgi:hypothetical protein
VTAVWSGLVALAFTLGLLIGTARPRFRRPRPGARRILVPFTDGQLDRTVLDAAIRIARAENGTLVPAYLLRVPYQYAEDSPLADQVGVAMPLLEAVEHAAHRAGVPVDARIEKGRTPTHALRRLWEVERFDRIVAPADSTERQGFSARDVTWILEHAPAETLILKPVDATDGRRAGRAESPAWGSTLNGAGPAASSSAAAP